MKIAVLTTDNRHHNRTYSQPVPHFGTAPEALLAGFRQLPEVEVHVISCTQKPMRSPDKLADNIWFHSIYVPKIGWTKSTFQGCIRAVKRLLKASVNPDIIHGQGTEKDCAITAVFSGYPNVLTIHGNMRLIAEVNKAKPFTYYWLAAQLEKVTIPRSAGVVCITSYTRDAVKDLARKTWLVPNAVDPSFFEVQAEPDGSRTVLCVGNVSLRKNQNAFIQALDPLARKLPFKVLFLGLAPAEDPYAAEFLSLIATRPWCVYGGFADREKLRTHFKDATLVALPSLEDNCPMVVLEAMAAGVPVVAAKVGGVPDLIEDGKTGLFCDPLDAASMALGIQRMLENPAMAREMANSAKAIARERFHPLAIAQRHVEIYREVLGTKPAR